MSNDPTSLLAPPGRFDFCFTTDGTLTLLPRDKGGNPFFFTPDETEALANFLRRNGVGVCPDLLDRRS